MPKTYKNDHLRPLPMRITQKQYDRLRALRSRSGLSIQEHVRRGLDFYLDAALDAPVVRSTPPEGETPVENASERFVREWAEATFQTCN